MFDRYRKIRRNGTAGGTGNAFLPQAEESFDDIVRVRPGHFVKMFRMVRSLRSRFVLPSLFAIAFCVFSMSASFITDGLRDAAGTLAHRCTAVIELFDRMSGGTASNTPRAAGKSNPSKTSSRR